MKPEDQAHLSAEEVSEEARNLITFLLPALPTQPPTEGRVPGTEESPAGLGGAPLPPLLQGALTESQGWTPAQLFFSLKKPTVPKVKISDGSEWES